MRNAHDIHHDCNVSLALNGQAISTDTTTAGNIIDTKGYEALEFLLATKTITDGNYTAKIEHGDNSALSDAAVVASTDLLGALPAFADDTDDNAVARVGYIGKKRYVRLSIVSDTTTTGVDFIIALALRANAHHKPVAEQAG